MLNAPLIMVVGSLNPTKIEAARVAASRMEPFIGKAVVDGCQVDSFAQPFDEEVSIGGKNRARQALARGMEKWKDGMIMGVGMEGGIVALHGKHYITAYVHVMLNDGREHGAWTAFIEAGDIARHLLKNGQELGSFIQELREKRGWPWHGGAFGTLTGGLYPRLDSLADALVLALSRLFITPPGEMTPGKQGIGF